MSIEFAVFPLAAAAGARLIGIPDGVGSLSGVFDSGVHDRTVTLFVVLEFALSNVGCGQACVDVQRADKQNDCLHVRFLGGRVKVDVGTLGTTFGVCVSCVVNVFLVPYSFW